MAVFIDHVVHDHTTKELTEIGEQTDAHEAKIARHIGQCILGLERNKEEELSWFSRLMGKKPADTRSMRKSISVHSLEQVSAASVKKSSFQKWLNKGDLIALLEECHIQTSTKYELFDILDCDCSGHLQFQELVSGLMHLRGPITKGDIVRISLKVSHLTKKLEDVLGGHDRSTIGAPMSPLSSHPTKPELKSTKEQIILRKSKSGSTSF
eukprot:TRINITY_DN21262_c0_g1_i2.p1 TRINITY_DN21262_c0_g1~~TRINITY_DN21262_c0_g1_i2.p1  ORF type:complete len:244 (-),score=23.77 TRINITY_DN21262_c0_g1_i2:101-730(-)